MDCCTGFHLIVANRLAPTGDVGKMDICRVNMIRKNINVVPFA